MTSAAESFALSIALNLAAEMSWARSPIAKATNGATVLTKVVTSAASGHSLHLSGHADRAGLTEQKQAEMGGGKQPNILIVPIGPPAGFSTRSDGLLEVWRHQLGQPVEALHQAARA
jgi:hypothetical protein